MKRSRLLFVFFFSLLILTLLAFTSCAPSEGGGDTEKTYRVMVSVPEGATVVGKNPAVGAAEAPPAVLAASRVGDGGPALRAPLPLERSSYVRSYRLLSEVRSSGSFRG